MTMLASVPEVLRSLLPELAESLGEYVGQAGGALTRGDALAAADAAHAVKGAAMRFGVADLADAAAKFEEQCRKPPGGVFSAKALKQAQQALLSVEAELAALRAVAESVSRMSESGGGS